jgi:hypothetical protein
VVEAVSKGLDVPTEFREVLQLPTTPTAAFTPLAEVERHLRRRLDRLDLTALAERAVRLACDRLRGRV